MESKLTCGINKKDFKKKNEVKEEVVVEEVREVVEEIKEVEAERPKLAA